MARKRVDRTRLLAFVSVMLLSLAPEGMGQDLPAGNKSDRDQLYSRRRQVGEGLEQS